MTVSVANITDVKAADAISVTEVQETAFVQLLVQRLSLFSVVFFSLAAAAATSRKTKQI